jgi:phosphoglycolate phosphatase
VQLRLKKAVASAVSKNIKKYKHIIWDWNGTLINDIDVVLFAMNASMKKRGMEELTVDEYKKVFTFPVKDYYKLLGFSFKEESFENVNDEFMTTFSELSDQIILHDGVETVLAYIKDQGLTQSILSACEHTLLNQQVKAQGIERYFAQIQGLSNNHADSKVQNGINLVTNLSLDPQTVLFIGDTSHDAEVAKAIGCDSMIIANGHQHYDRVKNIATYTVASIADVIDYLG